ncbi:MAG: ABC transporter permease [Trueperaceae bacterium]|nr:ABC transporter permease [Trueperaceae bacterium]
MLTFIARRLLVLPLIIIAVSVLIVGLLQLLSPLQRATAFMTSEQQARNADAIIRQYGLDKPFPVQYWNWLKQAVQGNLGYSRSASMTVMQAFRTYIPASFELAIFAVIPIIGFGIWIGTLSAIHRNTIFDQAARFLAIVGWSLPTFVFGIWLLSVFYGGMGWFGIGRVGNDFVTQLARGDIVQYTKFMTVDAVLNGRFDMLLDALGRLVLPVTTLTVVIMAQYMRVMRGSLLDALSKDYVRTARAKGLPDKEVTLKHARRNAMIPVITLSGFTIAGLLNGTVVVETIFGYRGLGLWFATAAVQLDIPAVVGFALFVALLIVVANLAVDVTYALVDPRIRFD